MKRRSKRSNASTTLASFAWHRKIGKWIGIWSRNRKVILKNRSIDPRFQISLYRRLKRSAYRPLPVFPDNPAFYSNLESIFQLIAEHLLQDPLGSYRHYLYLANLWIRQTPYKQLLESQIQYEKYVKKTFVFAKEKEEVNRIIEALDEELEDIIRFDYTRGLKCYSDAIEQIMSEENWPRPPQYCSDLSTFLEAGASDGRILYLIGVGLSRTVAIEILNAVDGVPVWHTLKETIAWLRDNISLLKEKMPPLLFVEVERVIASG